MAWRIRNQRDAKKSPLNIQLLDDAVSWAIHEFNGDKDATVYDFAAGRWNQGDWALGFIGKRTLLGDEGRRYTQVKCGSAFCIAGNICAAQGDRFVVPEWNIDVDSDEMISVTSVLPKGSKAVVTIEARAEALLGVDATSLFSGGADIEDLIYRAQGLAHEHGYTLTLPDLRGEEE